MAINAPNYHFDWMKAYCQSVMDSVQANFGGDGTGFVYNAAPFYSYGEENQKGVPNAVPSIRANRGPATFMADMIKPGFNQVPGMTAGVVTWTSGTIGSLMTEFNFKIIGRDDSEVLFLYQHLATVLRPTPDLAPPIISSRLLHKPDITEWFDEGNLGKNGKRGCNVRWQAPIKIPYPTLALATILTASVTASLQTGSLPPTRTSSDSTFILLTSGSVFT